MTWASGIFSCKRLLCAACTRFCFSLCESVVFLGSSQKGPLSTRRVLWPAWARLELADTKNAHQKAKVRGCCSLLRLPFVCMCAVQKQSKLLARGLASIIRARHHPQSHWTDPALYYAALPCVCGSRPEINKSTSRFDQFGHLFSFSLEYFWASLNSGIFCCTYYQQAIKSVLL